MEGKDDLAFSETQGAEIQDPKMGAETTPSLRDLYSRWKAFRCWRAMWLWLPPVARAKRNTVGSRMLAVVKLVLGRTGLDRNCEEFFAVDVKASA